MIIGDKRALAYIVEVDEIRPIPNYDRVVHARVGGWWVIISKADELKVGDRCVYFEVDSKCPENDERFAFLQKRKYKVKTIKMCGVYSQGLLMPLSLFPELEGKNVHEDVTEILHVRYAEEEDNIRKANSPDKYKKMAARHPRWFSKPVIRKLMKSEFGKRFLFLIFGKRKDKKGGFPSFVSKTDEERCLAGNTWIVTNKGTFKLVDIVEKQMNVEPLCVSEDGKVEYKPIVSYQKYKKSKTIKFRYTATRGNHEIYCTPDHRLLTNNGYKRADQIGYGDSLMTIRGRQVGDEVIQEIVPVKIVSIGNGAEQFVYDIEVADNHNFLSNGIISHNCENMPWIIEDNDTEWVATEKCDGSSCTYALERKGRNKFEFYVCSRNVRLDDENTQTYHNTVNQHSYNIYWKLAKKYNVEEKLKDYLKAHPDVNWICIQGEGVGSVQGNPLKLEEDDLYVFNLITSKQGRLPSQTGKSIIESWGMKWVPILGVVTMPETMEELKLSADGMSSINPEVKREGIVYRSLDGQRSFKNVSREYLMSKEKKHA